MPTSPFLRLRFHTGEQQALKFPAPALKWLRNLCQPALLPRLSGFKQLGRGAAECLGSVSHRRCGISSAAGALSLRPLSGIYKLISMLIAETGNVSTCHSYSRPKCFVPTAALTTGCWHHLLVIVCCATDTSGFRRRYNLIIRPHLHSNHESHSGEDASKSWDAVVLFSTSLSLAKTGWEMLLCKTTLCIF